jgi:hypothetical protein
MFSGGTGSRLGRCRLEGTGGCGSVAGFAGGGRRRTTQTERGVGYTFSLDAIICGSVAVTRDGRRCGKGEGYSDLEFAILRELGHPSCLSPRPCIRAGMSEGRI